MAFIPDTSFLALRYRSGTPQVIIYNDFVDGSTPTQTLGNTFGTVETSGDANQEQAVNRVVWFQNALIATVGTAIYRSTDYGQTWVSVQTLTNIITNNSSKSGLHPIYIDGVLTLCMFYRSTDGIDGFRGMLSTDGVSWETEGPFNPSIAGGAGSHPFVDDIVFQSNIICKSVSDRMFIYSPRGSIYAFNGVLENIGGSQNVATSVTAKNRLFFIWFNGSSRISFGEWAAPGRVTEHLTDVLGITVSAPGAQCRYGLIYDGAFDEFLAIVYNSTGWEFARISGITSGIFSSTNISSAARPTIGAMASTTPPANSRVTLINDDERNLGGIPPWRINYSINNDVGTAFDNYDWGGFNALPIGFGGDGGDASHALPSNRTMGGSPFITLGQPRIELVGREFVTNVGFGGRDLVRLNFKVYSGNLPFPQNNVIVQAFHTAPVASFPNVPSIDNYPQVPADFLGISPSGFLLGNGKVIQGITADDGTTIYEALWLVPTYIANGTRYKLTMRAILPIN